jgi:hypothetical protein
MRRRTKMFTRKQILDAANKEYPDGYLSNYYDEAGQPKTSHGDILAQFIVAEIAEVLDVEADVCDRLGEIEDRMEEAIGDLFAVLESIRGLHRQVPGHEDDEELEFEEDLINE